MARISLRQLLDDAAQNSYGVPAFNINNLEQGMAIMEAAKQFGTAGRAARIRPVTLADMAKRYKSGSLDPQLTGRKAA